MRSLGLNELRDEFLDFFEERDHNRLESFSLVPMGDASLLLINAGMAPLKDYFVGTKKMAKNRAVSSQKCIRTIDIDRVGKTARHGTFFEMLGNFSFGDYFKKEAIAWAWEFLTMTLELNPEEMWVSVYEEDDEAYDIWKDEVGVPEERIVRLGKEDNFWELEVGPCGPCSEIYVDRGIKYGCSDPDCKPGCDCDRFLEVWNLVFTQFDKDAQGEYHLLDKPNIDTGMGLERLAMVIEGVDNIFEVKVIRNIISKIEELSQKAYHSSAKIDESMRVISDHVRAVMFLVADGVIPSNEGRGYVLRRLIRRAVRHGRLIGIEGPFLTKIGEAVITSYKEHYPELDRDRERIFKIISTEEEKFSETINQGLERLHDLIDRLDSKSMGLIDGATAFRLYDTFGFPLDLTMEIAAEKGFEVDQVAFYELVKEQKIRSRESRLDDGGWIQAKEDLEVNAPATVFIGYDTLEGESVVQQLFLDHSPVTELKAGDTGILIVEQTPFYALGGGQVGDSGQITTENSKIQVTNTTHDADGVYLHHVKVLEGEVATGQRIELKVNPKERGRTMKNHSATHLLHKALRTVLGNHVQQAGSYVDEHRLRFDFSHYEGISKADLQRIEAIVNEYIEGANAVKVGEMSMTQANELGAIGLFEDKYKDVVRVVQMGDVSTELCGGTHVHNTSEIQMFKILSESGIAAGVRRIEAITGHAVYEYLTEMEQTVQMVAENLRTHIQDVVKRSGSIVEELKKKDKEIEKIRFQSKTSSVDEILEQIQEVQGVHFISQRIDNLDMNTIRKLSDTLRDKLGSGLVVLGSLHEGKLLFTAAVTKDLIETGLNAGNIVREVAKQTGGNGGGRPDFATAGGKDPAKVDAALKYVKELIQQGITK